MLKILRESFLCDGQGADRRTTLYKDRSCSTVFQSYQDSVKVIMKDCVQWNLVQG